MATPVWSGASVGSPPKAGQINQFLGTHASTFLYTGTSYLSQLTGGAGTTSTNSLYIAQSFTPAANQSHGRTVLTASVTGAPPPLTISIQANVSGAPSGTPLVTTVVPPGFFAGSATALTIPLPVALTGGTLYWVVINAVGTAGNLYTFSHSNQVTGVSTSTNGIAWTAQAYGLLYNMFNQAVVQPLAHTYEDAGARWTTWANNANGTLAKLSEYTVAQAANDYVQSIRSWTYTSGWVTTIA